MLLKSIVRQYVRLSDRLYFNSATCSDDLYIKLWNVAEDYQTSTTLRGHEHTISSVRFLPGDDQIVSSSRDNTVRIWNVQTLCAPNHHLPCCLTADNFVFFSQALYQDIAAARRRVDTMCQTKSERPTPPYLR